MNLFFQLTEMVWRVMHVVQVIYRHITGPAGMIFHRTGILRRTPAVHAPARRTLTRVVVPPIPFRHTQTGKTHKHSHIHT